MKKRVIVFIVILGSGVISFIFFNLYEFGKVKQLSQQIDMKTGKANINRIINDTTGPCFGSCKNYSSSSSSSWGGGYGGGK